MTYEPTHDEAAQRQPDLAAALITAGEALRIVNTEPDRLGELIASGDPVAAWALAVLAIAGLNLIGDDVDALVTEALTVLALDVEARR